MSRVYITIQLFLFFALLAPLQRANAQTDSLALEPKALGIPDIIPAVDITGEGVKMVSGNRFPTTASDLPFSTYVITAEEIRQNGYETLVDALKMVPGIRVSQPGSAIEGETFLMRGLLGNTYAKILIDDVPIKPSFLAAMPIGAQLPIKEAERIEVVFGSGAALYGADASAGVINIVTKKSEKPVFMQADLSVGGGQYSAVNVMFGGKLGRDRHIFKYFAYASNVLFEERNIFYDRGYNYNPAFYPGLDFPGFPLDSVPNYANTSSGQPLLTNTPHLSRRFGGYIKYRRMTLSLETMYRRDHSSLGLNPVAVSYRNPLTYTGERIWRANLNFFKNKPKHNRKTDITWVQYRMDDRSSILYVKNQLAGEFAAAASTASLSVAPDSVDIVRRQLFAKNYERFLDGERYRFGVSGDLRLEHIQNYRLFKRITLTGGINGRLAGGWPATEFLTRPLAENGDLDIKDIDGLGLSFDTTTFSISPDLRNLAEANVFGQLFYNGKRFILAGGINQTWYATIDRGDDFVNTLSRSSERLSGLFKITEDINIRSSWGRSFRIPNEWYAANSYLITSTSEEFLSRNFPPLQPEVTTSWESGIRFKSGENIGAEFTWFNNETSNLINYRRFGGPLEDSTRYIALLGYQNSAGSKVRFWGGQVLLNFTLNANDKTIAKGHYAYGWTKSRITLASGEGVDLPQGEGRLHQFKIAILPTTNTTFIFDYVRAKGLGRQGGTNGSDKYRTLDLTARYAFTERFDAYVKIINLFNQQYSGIPASRTPDDLIYNPQTGFFLRLGMNYFLD